MDYNVKLRCDRWTTSSITGRNFDEEMESDRGRAINSAAVRRLQQKTQVFPLETNAAVRSRLTHSLEVQQTGRYIAKLVLKRFDQKGVTEAIGLDDKRDGFISAIEIACLLHDVGNPPFGHFGEKAINIWAQSKLKGIFIEKYGVGVENELLISDLMTFEGNAQAIRLLHNLQNLNLTFTQIACLIKYTRAAYEGSPEQGDAFAYRKKKPGYYYSEQNFIERLNHALRIDKGCRFPLTYIMEAADDISYCIADLDDALDKEILTVHQLHQAINDTWESLKGSGSIEGDRYLPDIADKALKKYDSESHNKNHKYMLTLRTILVNDLAQYAADRFVENHNSIYNGTFDEPLLGGSDKFNLATETLKKVATAKVFSDREVERLELKGYAVISGLLNLYTPLLQLSLEEFEELSKNEFLKTAPVETRLFHGLSSKHKRTYFESVKQLFDKPQKSLDDGKLELYYRSRLIIDYISGMTDRFALDEFRELSASI